MIFAAHSLKCVQVADDGEAQIKQCEKATVRYLGQNKTMLNTDYSRPTHPLQTQPPTPKKLKQRN